MLIFAASNFSENKNITFLIILIIIKQNVFCKYYFRQLTPFPFRKGIATSLYTLGDNKDSVNKSDSYRNYWKLWKNQYKEILADFLSRKFSVLKTPKITKYLMVICQVINDELNPNINFRS